jgi:hypothetical protein
VQYTRDLLFRELWLSPALAPRDRSLVTVSALVASGQAAQVTYHLNRAMESGLTKAEASEVLTQLAFYAGGRTCSLRFQSPKQSSKTAVSDDIVGERPASRHIERSRPLTTQTFAGEFRQPELAERRKPAPEISQN